MTVAETQEVQSGFVTVAPNIVAEAHAARRDAEALRILEKRLKTAKRRFKDLFAEMDATEFRDAAGNRVATLNFRAPEVINQDRLWAEYPKVAAEVTEPNPYTYPSFP
jgi:hypothetical protein